MRTKMEITWLRKISNFATLRQGSEKVFQEILNELKRCKFKELSGFIVATAEWILEFNDLFKTNRTSSSTQWRADGECIHQSRHYLYDRAHACHTGSVDGMDRPNYIQTLKRTGNYTHIYAIVLITRISRCDRIWFIIKPLYQELLTEFGSLLDKALDQNHGAKLVWKFSKANSVEIYYYYYCL